MPRAHTILQSEYPYHITARCMNKEWFNLPLPQVWQIFGEQLTFMSWAFEAKIIAFVLMHNHFHLLIRTPKSNISEIMAFFMRETSRSLNKKNQRINQVFGGPYFRTIIGNEHYLMHAYKYVYANPLRAGLTQRCETYPYSSLNFILGGGVALFPVCYDEILFENIDGTLSWLNADFDEEVWNCVGHAMHKRFFKLRKVNWGRSDNPLETQLF